MMKNSYGLKIKLILLSAVIFACSSFNKVEAVPVPGANMYDNYNVFFTSQPEPVKADSVPKDVQPTIKVNSSKIIISEPKVKNTLSEKFDVQSSGSKPLQVEEKIIEPKYTEPLVFENIPQNNSDNEENKMSVTADKPEKKKFFKNVLKRSSLDKGETASNSEAETSVPTIDKLDSYSDIRNQAKVLYNSNNLTDALAEFSKIPDADKISDDWLFLANIAQDNGKDVDAVFYLKKAIQADDSNFKAHYNLGNIYLADEKTGMALAEYNKVLKIKKDYAYAHYNKGCCYLKRNGYYNAKYEFGLAIKADPSVPAFYYNLAYACKMLNKDKKAQEALDMYEKLMTE